MTSIGTAAPVVPGRLEQYSTRVAFFIAGFSLSAWAPLVPYAKARLALDDASLGLLLLCLGIGSILSMPLAGALTVRYGCRRMILWVGCLACLCLPLLATVTTLPLMVATLFVFGASMGVLDCVINFQAIIVERASGKTMMSGFHGLFSCGGIAGAAGVSALLSVGVWPWLTMVLVSLLIGVALYKAYPHLLGYGSEAGGPVFAIPQGVVLFIGLLCFTVFLTEGAMLDWSAVFLSAQRGVEPSYAGFGYAVFALAMTLGRLGGDPIVRRLGPHRIILFGGFCAAAGMAVATLVAHWQVALLGYALVGIGCSNIVPVFYSAVGRQKTMPENVAVPAITTLGYLGILMGPAGIGFVAHLSSLDVAFMILAVMLLGVALSGRFLRV
ncbi:MFS transporter [Pseudomonas sp. GD03842]|uniref:MFS transporter n=1 Tax=unclassified Pseudomonas TaxID=196821 RepID=UPI000D35FAFA|nr:MULTISPECIES: MFS transporter [unclassified Pseudomonas]MDH0745439.1 MFS transporter [Pseudomonas sp. GD03842]RAU45177.1 MFS transporter [Pseudomonas sp. RIT 409]RAU51373.1 MFS transporter [Pseudomonas sp. RIT 412]